LAQGLVSRPKSEKFCLTHIAIALKFLQDGKEAPAAGLHHLWFTLAQGLALTLESGKSIMHWKSLARCDNWPGSRKARVTNWPPLLVTAISMWG